MGIKPSVSVGDVFKTNSCGDVKVIKYESAKSVHVTFMLTKKLKRIGLKH